MCCKCDTKQCCKSCSALVLVARNEVSSQSSDKGKSVALTANKVLLFQELLCLGKKMFQEYPMILLIGEFHFSEAKFRFAFRIIHRIQVEHFVLFVWKFWILRKVSSIQQNKFIIIDHTIVMAFQEKIPSVLKG